MIYKHNLLREYAKIAYLVGAVRLPKQCSLRAPLGLDTVMYRVLDRPIGLVPYIHSVLMDPGGARFERCDIGRVQCYINEHVCLGGKVRRDSVAL